MQRARRVPPSLDREVGELRVRLQSLDSEMRVLRIDVREIRDALVSIRGGWRILACTIALSASLGAMVGKLSELFVSR